MNARVPALIFSRAGLFSPVRDSRALTEASEKRIQRGDYSGMTIVDSDRRLLRVEGIKRLGYAPPFGGFRLFTSRLKRIELEVQGEETLSQEQVRELVWQGIQEQRSFWESAWDLADLQKQLQSCESVGAIVDLLLPAPELAE